MRMAHLYPEQEVKYVFPTHHEIHLREEEAVALTKELQNLDADPSRFPLLTKIHKLLGSRNTDYEVARKNAPAKTTYSYPSGSTTTIQEVSGANKEIAKGEHVRWEPINWRKGQEIPFRTMVRP